MNDTTSNTSSTQGEYAMEFSENDMDMVIYRMIGKLAEKFLSTNI